MMSVFDVPRFEISSLSFLIGSKMKIIEKAIRRNLLVCKIYA